MKKILLLLLLIINAQAVFAQEQQPLFDEPMANVPNVGRGADPLDKLILIPEPLPEISIDLDVQKKQKKVVDNGNIVKKDNTQQVSDSSVDLKKYEREEPVAIQNENAPIDMVNFAPPASQTKRDIAPVPLPTESQTVMQSDDEIANLFGKAHDVYAFEVAGVGLGMSPEEVLYNVKQMGYQQTRVQYGIPMFRTAFYEQNCRNRRLYVLHDVRQCIEEQADKDGEKFISSMTFKRPQTKEYLRVLFTSYATDNKAFKIYYENEGDNSLTMTQRNLAKQLRRKDMFWRMMFDNYGLPDDAELIIWGDPDKAYMQATMTGTSYNAYIVLEDKELQDDDYFAAEDEKENLVYPNSFTFAPNLGEE